MDPVSTWVETGAHFPGCSELEPCSGSDLCPDPPRG